MLQDRRRDTQNDVQSRIHRVAYQRKMRAETLVRIDEAVTVRLPIDKS